MITELVDTLPLVTQNSNARQLSSLGKLLKWGADELVDVHKYLNKSGVDRNLRTQPGSSSKSYTVANTAAELRKMFPRWTSSILDLVTNCLQLKPENRKTAAQLLNMKFFTGGRFSLNFDELLEFKIKNDNMYMM